MSKDNPDRNLVLRNGVYYLRTFVKGKLIQKSLRTGNVAFARKGRDKALSEIETWAFSDDSAVTWRDAVAEWIKYEGKHLPPKTAKRYLLSLKIAEPFLINFNIASINGRIIGDFIKMRRRNDASGATIRRDLTALSRVFDYAISENWRDDNPTLSRRRLIKERRDPITLPLAEDIEEIISVSSYELGNLIRAAWLTGCRMNELVTARWRNYDPLRKSLTVIGKGNKMRVISLRPVAGKDALEFFNNIERKPDCELIFPKRDGDVFKEPSTAFGHVRKIVTDKMGRQGRMFHQFRFHDLRHMFAVEALKAGMNIYMLQQHLGHSSIKVTEMYLAHLTHDEQSSAKGIGIHHTSSAYAANSYGGFSA